jgi:hypothetical protein
MMVMKASSSLPTFISSPASCSSSQPNVVITATIPVNGMARCGEEHRAEGKVTTQRLCGGVKFDQFVMRLMYKT